MILPEDEYLHMTRKAPSPKSWIITEDGSTPPVAVYASLDDAALALGREVAIGLASTPPSVEFHAHRYVSVFGHDAREDDPETLQSNLFATAMFWLDTKE